MAFFQKAFQSMSLVTGSGSPGLEFSPLHVENTKSVNLLTFHRSPRDCACTYAPVQLVSGCNYL